MAEPNISEPLENSQKIVFWGCFIALVTTSFAFFSRMYLCDVRFGTQNSREVTDQIDDSPARGLKNGTRARE